MITQKITTIEDLDNLDLSSPVQMTLTRELDLRGPKGRANLTNNIQRKINEIAAIGQELNTACALRAAYELKKHSKNNLIDLFMVGAILRTINFLDNESELMHEAQKDPNFKAQMSEELKRAFGPLGEFLMEAINPKEEASSSVNPSN